MLSNVLRAAGVAGALGLAAGLVPSSAAAQDYDAQAVKKSVTTADMRAIVAELGHEEREIVEDDYVVVARNADGLTYSLFGTACDVGSVAGCQGIMAQVRYDVPETVTPQRLAAANLRYAALNVWADFENDVMGATRYIVIDHGVTMANLRANIEVLLDLAPDAVATANGTD